MDVVGGVSVGGPSAADIEERRLTIAFYPCSRRWKHLQNQLSCHDSDCFTPTAAGAVNQTLRRSLVGLHRLGLLALGGTHIEHSAIELLKRTSSTRHRIVLG